MTAECNSRQSIRLMPDRKTLQGPWLVLRYPRSRLRSADRIPAKSRYYGGVEQLEARRVHAPKAAGSNPAPAIEHKKEKHLSHPGRRRIAGVLFGMIRNGR